MTEQKHFKADAHIKLGKQPTQQKGGGQAIPLLPILYVEEDETSIYFVNGAAGTVYSSMGEDVTSTPAAQTVMQRMFEFRSSCQPVVPEAADDVMRVKDELVRKRNDGSEQVKYET